MSIFPSESPASSLQLALEEIVREHQDLHIRLLADQRIAGPVGADFLMQIDDYEIRLALLDAPRGTPALAGGQLQGFRSIFEENPSTELIVLTWTMEDLRSQKLNLQIIEYLLERPEQTSRFLAKAAPVQDVLSGILADHLKVWEAALISPEREAAAGIDLRKTFSQHLRAALFQEKERSFRTEEKKIAARQLPEERELRLVADVLNEALLGADLKTLAGRLVQPAKRGGG